jgi:hypothetical protein
MDPGGNPLAHYKTNDPDARMAAFGGDFQPGLYRYNCALARLMCLSNVLLELLKPVSANSPTRLRLVSLPLR